MKGSYLSKDLKDNFVAIVKAEREKYPLGLIGLAVSIMRLTAGLALLSSFDPL